MSYEHDISAVLHDCLIVSVLWPAIDDGLLQRTDLGNDAVDASCHVLGRLALRGVRV